MVFLHSEKYLIDPIKLSDWLKKIGWLNQIFWLLLINSKYLLDSTQKFA